MKESKVPKRQYTQEYKVESARLAQSVFTKCGKIIWSEITLSLLYEPSDFERVARKLEGWRISRITNNYKSAMRQHEAMA